VIDPGPPYKVVALTFQGEAAFGEGWQITRSRALIESRGGEIVAEFFDVDKSRSIPWQRRPMATALLGELKNPARAFDAVVIGEPHRAFTATSTDSRSPSSTTTASRFGCPKSAAPSTLPTKRTTS
jgi:hypothetical protein